MDNLNDVLETAAETLSELLKDEGKTALLLRKERCQWMANDNGEFDPN
jgi:hypothetical protein